MERADESTELTAWAHHLSSLYFLLLSTNFTLLNSLTVLKVCLHQINICTYLVYCVKHFLELNRIEKAYNNTTNPLHLDFLKCARYVRNYLFTGLLVNILYMNLEISHKTYLNLLTLDDAIRQHFPSKLDCYNYVLFALILLRQIK